MTGRALLLARVRAEGPMLVLCSLLLLVSAGALSALATLDGVAREDGLRARWQSLAPEQRAVEVTTTDEVAVPAGGPAAGEADAAVRADVEESLRTSGVTADVLSSARTAQLDVLRPLADGAQSLVLMAFDDLPALATLVDGAWPDSQGGASSAGPAAASMQADAAAALGVGVGDTVVIDVEGNVDPEFEVVATWRMTDTAVDGSASGTAGLGAASVAGSPLEVTGRLTASAVGPLVPADPTAIGPATRVWRVVPRVDVLTAAGVRALPGDLARMERRIRADPRLVNPAVDDKVRDGLPLLSNQVERAGAVSRVALLLVSVVVVTTILLVARLLVQRRAGQTALLRARGAAWRQVTSWAAVETLLLALPALGLALVALALGRSGLAATLAAGALGGSVLLAGPAALAGRRWEAVRAVAGENRRMATARWGAEVLTLAAAGLALWQLRRYRSLVVAGGDGPGTALGTDPVLVLAPTLALLAGALLVARLVAPVAGIAARALSRRAGLPAVMAAWHTSRAPTAHATSVLLVTLVVGSGVLVTGQHVLRGDEAERVAQQQVGSDLRLSATSVTGPRRDDAVAAATAVAAVDGVVGVSAVHTELLSTPVGAVTLASRTTGTDEALPEEAAIRPGVPAGTRVEVDLALDVTTVLPTADELLLGFVPDGASTTTVSATSWWLSTDGYAVSRPLDQIAVTAPTAGVPVRATATSVLDLPETPRRVDGETPVWELVAVDVLVPALDLGRQMGFEISAVRVDDGSLPPPGGWVVGTSPVARLLPTPSDAGYGGVLISTQPFEFEAVQTRLTPRSLTDVAGVSRRPLAATVTADLAAALGRVEGETLHLAGGSASLGVTAERVLETVPGVPAPAVVLDSRGTAAADLLQDRQAHSFETWQVTLDPRLAADDEGRRHVAEAVRGAAGTAGVEVTVTDRRAVRQALLDDPVGVSAARAVVVAAAVAGLLALAGVLAAAASTAAGRRRDEAVLAVLGTSTPQLRRADTTRTALLGVLSVVAGLLLGLAVLWWCGQALVGDQSQPGLPAQASVRVPWTGLAAAAAAGLLIAGAPLVRAPGVVDLGRELRSGETR